MAAMPAIIANWTALTETCAAGQVMGMRRARSAGWAWRHPMVAIALASPAHGGDGPTPSRCGLATDGCEQNAVQHRMVEKDRIAPSKAHQQAMDQRRDQRGRVGQP